MKGLLSILLVVLITGTAAYAQSGRGQRQEAMVRIHAAKMAYITDRLRLTSEQSANFVPVYNDYEREVKSARQSFMGQYKGSRNDEQNDSASMKYVDDNLDYQQAVIDLKRKYNDRFLKVISPQQLAELYKAEREFRQMLMRRLNQQGQGGRRR